MLGSPLKICRMRSSRLTGVDFSVALFCVLLMLLCVTTSSGETVHVESAREGKPSIKILNLLRTDQDRKKDIANALWAGVNAALFNISYLSESGRKIEFINISDNEYNDLLGTISAKLEKEPDLIAILGPFSNKDTTNVLESSVVRSNNLVCLSPFASSISLRKWTPNAFFMRADPRAELILLSRYIVQVLVVKRVGIMYLTGVDYGELESNIATKILKDSDHNISIIIYTQPYDTSFNQVAFNKFASQRPQAILVFGEASDHTDDFVRKCLTTKETAGSTLLGTFTQQYILTKIYRDLVKNKTIDSVDGKVITSGTNYQATDTEHNHVGKFREQMTIYTKSGNYGIDFSNANKGKYEKRFTETEFMLSGWIAGSIMAKVLLYETWVKDRMSLQKNLFSQNRFVIHEDFVVGDYGDTCPQSAADQGAICECNQGGHTVNLKQCFANDTMGYIQGHNYTFPDADCYPKDTKGALGVVVLLLYIQEEDNLLRAAKTYLKMLKLSGANSFNNSNSEFSTIIGYLDVSAPQLAEGVLNCTKDYHVSVFSGPTTADMPEDVVMINPFFKRPRLNALLSNSTVEIVPTLEQQFFVLMKYLSDDSVRHAVSSTKLTAVVRGLTPDESQGILNIVDKTAVTFDHTLGKKLSMGDGDTLTSGIEADGYTLLVGLDEEDAQGLAKYLQENVNACVVLSYRDFSLNYNGILNAFEKEDVTVQARLLTTTNLPLWTDYSPGAQKSSAMLDKFHKVIADKKYHTPLGFESFIVNTLLIQLVTLTNDDYKLLDEIYTEETLVLKHDMRFGPYEKQCTYTPSGATVNCTVKRNYGARDIYMLSMKRVLNASVSNDYPPTTPDISYSVPDHRRNVSRSLIVVIVVCCCVGFILILCVVWFLCSRGRDNRNAPSDVCQPVTLIFTDIESSTALWAMLPQLMPCAVAAHHELIRKAIAKHQCYEVKTVGDSFMIACKEAHTAVQVACEIQELMLRYRWGTDELDGAYREFEMRRRDEDAEYKPPTAMLTRDEYGALWNGLRVRIGIHTGLCDIRHDRVTGGVDYYGETSNMAARTETIGNGGQILVTEWAWWSLSHCERASFQCQSLGPQRLRGVPYSVEVYQLNSVPGRRYAGLRTEFDALLPADDKGDTTSNDASALLSSVGTIAGPAAAMAAVLTNCFSPFPVVQRIKGLQPLLQKWNIAIPQRSSRITDEDYCQGMISRLAIKMSSVAQMRQRLANVDTNGLAHSKGHRATDASSSGIIASAVVQRQCSPPLAAGGTKVDPLNPYSHSESPQPLQHVTWMHSDGDGVAFKADAIADESFPCDRGNAQGGSSRTRRVFSDSDSVVSIHILMPSTLPEKYGG